MSGTEPSSVILVVQNVENDAPKVREQAETIRDGVIFPRIPILIDLFHALEVIRINKVDRRTLLYVPSLVNQQ